MVPIKETTALGSSVGADAGQPSQMYTTMYDPIVPDIPDECNEDFEDTADFMRKLQRDQDPTFLNTVSYNELMDQSFPYRREIIEGFLGTGAYILAGPPKIGKSFLVAQIAYYISNGLDLWGYKVHRGTVLYLALEDDNRRLQNRMARMCGEVKLISALYAKHTGHSVLQPSVIIFQCKIEHSPSVDLVAP